MPVTKKHSAQRPQINTGLYTTYWSRSVAVRWVKGGSPPHRHPSFIVASSADPPFTIVGLLLLLLRLLLLSRSTNGGVKCLKINIICLYYGRDSVLTCAISICLFQIQNYRSAQLGGVALAYRCHQKSLLIYYKTCNLKSAISNSSYFRIFDILFS